MSALSPKNQVRYCPFCGADMAKHGHDDDCGRDETDYLLMLIPIGITAKMRIMRR